VVLVATSLLTRIGVSLLKFGLRFLDCIQNLSSVPLVRSICSVRTSQATHYQTVELAFPLLLFFPRQRVALEIKRDLLQAECGRPEQSIKLAGLVFLVLHDEGVLLTEIRFAKICCR
jgi:hypothetical protein